MSRIHGTTLRCEAAARLRDAVDGLHDAERIGNAVGVVLLEAGRHAAVDYLAVLEVALQVGGDPVDAAHLASRASGEREEGAGRAVPQRGREYLIEVDTLLERAALDAQPRLERAVALDLEDPRQLVQAATLGHLVGADALPRLVVRVVAQLLRHRFVPATAGLGLAHVCGCSLGVGAEGVEHGRVDRRGQGAAETGGEERRAQREAELVAVGADEMLVVEDPRVARGLGGAPRHAVDRQRRVVRLDWDRARQDGHAVGSGELGERGLDHEARHRGLHDVGGGRVIG